MDAAALKKFLEDLLKLLVDYPEDIEVSLTNPVDEVWEVILYTRQGDVGKVIGRNGATIEAVRQVVKVIMGRYKQRCYLKSVAIEQR